MISCHLILQQKLWVLGFLDDMFLWGNLRRFYNYDAVVVFSESCHFFFVSLLKSITLHYFSLSEVYTQLQDLA